MPNMNPKKTPVKTQEPDVRNKNFDEVILGYNESEAKLEAERCLNCKTRPCVNGCPVGVNIPEFINEIRNSDFAKAYDIIKATNSLPSICGRVCPQETQCESRCVRGIKGEPVSIGRLERYVADLFIDHDDFDKDQIKPNGHKVAIIGSGPSGLSCAGELVKMGYDVTIFEALHTPGGVLSYGIPEFRLPKEIVRKEIEKLKYMGVKIENNMVIGKILSLDELKNMGFRAIYICTGAGLPNFMNIDGENLTGVYSANEFLTRVNLMKAHIDNYDTPIRKMGNVAIVGGGNVAMDAARCAKRLGAENVYVIYRRSEEEMPARIEEVHHAKEEGIIFKFLTNPIKIIGNENSNVTAIECVNMALAEADESGRRRPEPIEGSNFVIEVDNVIMAIGNAPNPIIKNSTEDLEVNKRGCIIVDEDSLSTSIDGVFAGGDSVTGAATVILAMGAGKKASVSIDKYIKSNFSK